MPLIETPFEWIALDFIGPLPRSASSPKYVLVLMDYASHFPEVIPMQNMQAKGMCQSMIQVFSCVGILKEILSDSDASFTSTLVKTLCKEGRSIYTP